MNPAASNFSFLLFVVVCVEQVAKLVLKHMDTSLNDIKPKAHVEHNEHDGLIAKISQTSSETVYHYDCHYDYDYNDKHTVEQTIVVEEVFV